MYLIGVYGEYGKGLVYVLGEEGGWVLGDGNKRGKLRVDVRLMMFGKVVGCFGGELIVF